MACLGPWMLSACLLTSWSGDRPRQDAGTVSITVLTRRSTGIIEHLIDPAKLGAPLVRGWTIESLSVAPTHAVFVLVDPKGKSHRLKLLSLSASCPRSRQNGIRKRCARSRHFLLVLPTGLPNSLAHLLIARIQANDQDNPWQQPGPNDKKRTRSTIPGTWPMLPVYQTRLPAPGMTLQFLIIVWFLITVLTIPAFQRALHLDVFSWAAALAIFALAIWLRLSQTMPLPVGPNGHANVTILELFRPQPQGFLFYGNTFWAFFHLVGGILERCGLTAEPWQDALPKLVFVTNALLGASIPMAALAMARLSGMSRTSSLTAALLLACLPIHLRLSASESRFVLAGFFLIAALVQSMAAWRLRSWALTLAAVPAWTLATQARPEIALVLAALPFALSTASSPLQRKESLWLAVGLAVGLLLVLDGQWLLSITSRALSGEGATRQLSLSCLFRSGSWLGPNPSITWMDPRFVPRWMPLSALVGLLATGLRHGINRLLFWLLLCATSLATGACFTQDINTARLQAHSLPWLAILAAQGLQETAGISFRLLRAALSRTDPSRIGPARTDPADPESAPASPRAHLPSLLITWVRGLPPAFLLWTLTVPAITSAWHQGRRLLGPTCTAQKEYLFVTRQVALLPGRCTILLPGRQGIHNSYQPFYAKDKSQGRPTWIVVKDPRGAQALVSKLMASRQRACLLFYRPSVCSASQPDSPFEPQHFDGSPFAPIPESVQARLPGRWQSRHEGAAWARAGVRPGSSPQQGREVLDWATQGGRDVRAPRASLPDFKTALARLPAVSRATFHSAPHAASRGSSYSLGHANVPVTKRRSSSSWADGSDHHETTDPTGPGAGCSLERQLRRHWRLVPLAVTKLAARPCWGERFRSSLLSVGFYRIVEPRPTGGPTRHSSAAVTRPAEHAGPPNALFP